MYSAGNNLSTINAVIVIYSSFTSFEEFLDRSNDFDQRT